MIPLLAQLPEATPKQIGEWLVAFAAVLVIVHMAKKLFVRAPSIESEFVTKTESNVMHAQTRSEIHKLETRVDSHLLRLEDKIGEKLDDLDTKRSRQVAELHNDIREVGEKLAHLSGQIERNQ